MSGVTVGSYAKQVAESMMQGAMFARACGYWAQVRKLDNSFTRMVEVDYGLTDDGLTERYALGPRRLAEGVERALMAGHAKHVTDWDCIDATDVIVQFALFGEVRYG